MSAARTPGAAPAHRCGYAAIAGRPNVGKSTLLNRLVGAKLSITSRKPQTTRANLLGISNSERGQIIYVDTPGLQERHRNALTRHMGREASGAVASVDVVLFVVEAGVWTEGDDFALRQVKAGGAPLLLVVNKIDRLRRRSELLPYIDSVQRRAEFAAVVPVSALRNDNLDALSGEVLRQLPEGPAMFPADQRTDRESSFLAAEIVREKLTRKLGAELPYALTVAIDELRKARGVMHVGATIWVESEGQKAIVIGRAGAVLKSVGEQARRDLERLFQGKVHLRTWVKVKRDWTASDAALRRLGYSR